MPEDRYDDRDDAVLALMSRAERNSVPPGPFDVVPVLARGRRRLVRRRVAMATSGVGAAALVVALLVVPSALMRGGTQRGTAPLPATTPTASPRTSVDALQAFRFPEEQQWRAEATEALVLERQVELRGRWQLPCPNLPQGGATGTRTLTVSFSGPEEGHGRQLAVYDDESEAGAMLDGLQSILRRCSKSFVEDSGETTSSSWVVRAADVGDDSFLAWTRTEQAESSIEQPGGQYVLAARRGSAVYLAAFGGAHLDPQGADDGPMQELHDAARTTMPLIDELLREGAVPSPDTSMSLGSAGAATIPSSFRFVEELSDDSWQKSSGDFVVERFDATSRMWGLNLAPCWPATTEFATDSKRTSMLTLIRSGPEHGESLQVALYPDERTAAAVMQDFRQALKRCGDVVTDDAGLTHRVCASESLDVGDEGLLALGSYEVDGRPALGADSVAVVRLENAVFLRSQSGEYDATDETAAAAKAVVVDSAQANIDGLCRPVRCDAT